MGQISYFLLYPSSRTVGIMPRPFLIRIRRHGTLRGFNVTTRSNGLPRFHFKQPKRLRFYVCYGPSHGRPNRLDGPLTSHSPYGSAHSTVHSAPRARVILLVGSHPTGSSRLVGWSILLSGSLHGYGEFLWSLLVLPDLSL